MKKVLSIIVCLAFALALTAQPKDGQRFDPKKFEAEMEQFITCRAGLTPTEASRFFPLFREMQAKQRSYFNEMRLYRHANPDDEEACRNAVAHMDEIDIKIKQLQRDYHQKFMSVMPAGKVLAVIKAEDAFHRQAFRRAAKHRPQDKKN